MRSIFETKMLIYQSKANLDVKILFGNIIYLIDPEIRKMLDRDLCENQDSIFHVGPLFTCYCNQNSFLKLTKALNLKFNAE